MEKLLLYKFFEGQTSLEEEVEIREWMEASPENERLFFKERKLFDAMILLTNKNQVEVEEPRRSGFIRKALIEVLKVAAIVTIVLSCTHLYLKQSSNPETVAMQTISVPPGQRVNITLPDGSNIWLNARTTLQYPISFNKEERKVILDGEAYLEVSKDPKNKFIVTTDKGDVEVLGTSFNVEAYSDSEVFETSLLEGIVEVRAKSDPAHVIQLTPNNKATLVNGRLWVEEITDPGKFDWREGLISFKGLRFAEIMKEFEKCYGITVVIENDRIKKHIFSGKFRQADGVDYALRVLQRDIQFNYIKDEENYTIHIK